MNSLSFKTRFGWISAFEEKGKIVRIKFGKHRNKGINRNLKNLKIKINSFFNKKNKRIKSNFLIEGNTIQKKVWRELTNIKIGKTKSYGEIAKKFKLFGILSPSSNSIVVSFHPSAIIKSLIYPGSSIFMCCKIIASMNFQSLTIFFLE